MAGEGESSAAGHVLPRLAPALYLIGLALVVQGVAQALIVGGPEAEIGSVRWRFGFMGVVFLYTPYPLIGMALASLTAALVRGPRMLLALAIGQWILTLACLGGFLIFLLDAAEVGATVPEPLRGSYTMTVAQTSLAGGLGICLFAVIAWATVSAYRHTASNRRRQGASQDAVLVGRKG